MEDRIQDKIIVNEVKNDGSQAHLYFDPTNKNCQAYGISAYIVTHVIASLFPTYSESLQMPVVVAGQDVIGLLRKKLEEIVYLENEYYQFEAKNIYDEEDYDRWAAKVRGFNED